MRAALADTPVILIVGARQVGKSTLVKRLTAGNRGSTYLTLDDFTAQGAAQADPAGFIADLDGTVVIDEVQRAPGLFLAIKASVDRDRRPGRFILTGSTNILALPTISDALTGRIEVIKLRPLSQGELAGTIEGFIDQAFSPSPVFASRPGSRHDLIERIVAGGYPEAIERTGDRRSAWFQAYVTAIIQRDVRDISRIEDLAALPRLLALLATRASGLLNLSDLSRSLGMPLTTVNRYLAVLETIMLVEPTPAWSSNLGRRLIRAPKVAMVDAGLIAHLQGMDAERLVLEPDRLGPIFEAFVIEELRRQLAWQAGTPGLFHYRDGSGNEVNAVLEARDGSLVGVEVKLSGAVTPGDTRGLRALRSAIADRFVRGIVLYTGDEVVPLGDRLIAVPVSALWSA